MTTEALNRLPDSAQAAEMRHPPTRMSLLWLGVTCGLAAVLWVMTAIGAFQVPASSTGTLVYMIGLAAATATVCSFSLGARYVLHYSMFCDHAVLLEEIRAARRDTSRSGDDATAEFSPELLQALAQNAIASARVAAMAEQISAKMDRFYWDAYTDAAHDLGHAGAEVIPFRGRGGA